MRNYVIITNLGHWFWGRENACNGRRRSRDRPSKLDSMEMVVGTVMPTTNSVVPQVLEDPVQQEPSKHDYTSTKNNRELRENTSYLS